LIDVFWHVLRHLLRLENLRD